MPYEAPYVSAWEAFVAAAHRHFNSNYAPNSGPILGAGGTNQLGYVRSGTWSGGESFVYCITNGTPGTGLSGLSGAYAYYCDLHGNPDCSSTPGASQSNTNNIWLKDYSNKINYVQSLAPTLPVLWPIDPIANDAS